MSEGKGMTLTGAIENVKNQEPIDVDWSPAVFFELGDDEFATAIATILNAVVKGELKHE